MMHPDYPRIVPVDLLRWERLNAAVGSHSFQRQSFISQEAARFFLAALWPILNANTKKVAFRRCRGKESFRRKWVWKDSTLLIRKRQFLSSSSYWPCTVLQSSSSFSCCLFVNRKSPRVGKQWPLSSLPSVWITRKRIYIGLLMNLRLIYRRNITEQVFWMALINWAFGVPNLPKHGGSIPWSA